MYQAVFLQHPPYTIYCSIMTIAGMISRRNHGFITKKKLSISEHTPSSFKYGDIQPNLDI